VSGVRHVNAAWLQSVANNPAPLWTCDDAYFSGNTGNGFTLHSASSGEFVYELGLRTSDVPQTMNNLPLATWANVARVFGLLYLGGATTYTLKVTRSGRTVTLNYQLD
jgi:hypothetical protein